MLVAPGWPRQQVVLPPSAFATASAQPAAIVKRSRRRHYGAFASVPSADASSHVATHEPDSSSASEPRAGAQPPASSPQAPITPQIASITEMRDFLRQSTATLGPAESVASAQILATVWANSAQSYAEASLLADALPLLSSALMRNLLEFSPRDCVRAAAALGSCRGGNPGLVLALAEQAILKAPTVPPKEQHMAHPNTAVNVPVADLAQLVYTLATAGLRPSNTCLVALAASAENRLDQLTGPQLARLLWGLVVLGCRPILPWLYAFEDASRTQLQDLDCDGLSRMMWACGEIGFVPGQSWMAGFLGASQHMLRTASAHELVTIAAGLARLNDAIQATAAGMPVGVVGQSKEKDTTPAPAADDIVQQLRTLPWLADARSAPEGGTNGNSRDDTANDASTVGSTLLSSSAPALDIDEVTSWGGGDNGSGASSSSSSSTAPVVADGVPLSEEWCRVLLRASDSLMWSMRGTELVTLLSSMVTLGITPTPAWLRRAAQATSSKLQDLNPRDQAACLKAISHLSRAGTTPVQHPSGSTGMKSHDRAKQRQQQQQQQHAAPPALENTSQTQIVQLDVAAGSTRPDIQHQVLGAGPQQRSRAEESLQAAAEIQAAHAAQPQQQQVSSPLSSQEQQQQQEQAASPAPLPEQQQQNTASAQKKKRGRPKKLQQEPSYEVQFPQAATGALTQQQSSHDHQPSQQEGMQAPVHHSVPSTPLPPPPPPQQQHLSTLRVAISSQPAPPVEDHSDLPGHTVVTQAPSFSLISTWISSFLDTTLPNLPRFPAPALAQLLLDVANAGGQPGVKWLTAYSSAIESRLEVLSTGDLLSVVVGLEALLKPHKKAKLVLPRSNSAPSSSPSPSFAAMTSNSSTSVSAGQTGGAFAQEFGRVQQAGQPGRGQASSNTGRKQRIQMASGQQEKQQQRLQQHQQDPSYPSTEEEVMDRLLRKVVSATEDRLSSFSIDQIARLMGSLASVRCMPPPSWSKAAAVALRSSQAALPELSAYQLAQLAGSVIRLRITTGQAWWAALTEATRPYFTVQYNTTGTASSTASRRVLPPLVLADLMWAVKLSKFQPDRAWWSGVAAAVEAHLGRKLGQRGQAEVTQSSTGRVMSGTA